MTMFYQLFQALFSSIGEDEAKQQGNVFASSPVVQYRKSESRLGPKIDLEEDIRRLQDSLYDGRSFAPGFCMQMKLQELAAICPRRRKHRRSAYKSLQNMLSSMGVTLTITK